MALSKKDGGRFRRGRARTLSVLLISAALIIAAAAAVALLTRQKADPAASSDVCSVQSDISTETKSDILTESETVSSESSDTAESPPSEASKPTESEGVPSSLGDAAQELLEGMSLEEKVYQLFIVTPKQLYGVKDPVTQAGSAAQAAFGHHPVGGVILFAENIKTPNQTTKMISGLQAASDLGLFIAVDEEGGKVARLGNNPLMGTTVFPLMREIGASENTENARTVGLTIGTEIKQFGFNLNLAPIADVNSNPNNPIIAERAFSSDPKLAAEMVAACVTGFRESGMLCTLKHFPGHGDTETDSHLGAAFSNKTLNELFECELLPFESGISAGAELIMVGHISLPNVTGSDLPACLSYEITTKLLRERLGFDGLIITDSLSMDAVAKYHSPRAAAVQAFKAGADILLMPENLDDAANGILDALKSGELSEKRLNESVYRILYTKLTQGIVSPSLI